MIAAPEPISAWHNPYLSPVGCVGNVSTPDPVAEIRAAEAWLREQGCTVARGPLDGSTWLRYRANIGPHERPLFLGEPDASPDPWRAAGYTERKRYCTTLADNNAQVRRPSSSGERRPSWCWNRARLSASVGRISRGRSNAEENHEERGADAAAVG